MHNVCVLCWEVEPRVGHHFLSYAGHNHGTGPTCVKIKARVLGESPQPNIAFFGREGGLLVGGNKAPSELAGAWFGSVRFGSAAV